MRSVCFNAKAVQSSHHRIPPLNTFDRFFREFRTELPYALYQTQEDLLAPWRSAARLGCQYLQNWKTLGVDDSLLRLSAAWLEVLGTTRLTHHRPPFAIGSVICEGRTMQVQEESILCTPFATLLHFAKPDLRTPQPRVLVVAPMSGHFATLLRNTVKTLLADHDVYITDWHSGRDIPLEAGPFGMDHYARHVIDFIQAIGAGSHVVAVCQPCVATLTAVARMSEDRDPCTPISMTLMAGPIDTQISPTGVNQLAKSKPLSWFHDQLITRVPARHAGASRAVYPGFLQIAAFVSMNQARHVGALNRQMVSRMKGDTETAEQILHFYAEYFAAADLPAEFYLETVDLVFQRHALPRGELMFEGRLVRPEAIVRTLLLTVEGQRDDICAVGQTMAAQDLCSSLKPFLRHHHVQPGVGHYGVFSGHRWEEEIYPIVRGCIFQAQHEIGARLPALRSGFQSGSDPAHQPG